MLCKTTLKSSVYYYLSVFCLSLCLSSACLLVCLPIYLRQTRYRVGISNWDSELDFRVGLSSWIFELDFRVGLSSWTFELDFRVWIPSWAFQQEASADVTSDLDPPPPHFFLYRKQIEIMCKLGVGRYSRQCLLFLLSNN